MFEGKRDGRKVWREEEEEEGREGWRNVASFPGSPLSVRRGKCSLLHGGPAGNEARRNMRFGGREGCV